MLAESLWSDLPLPESEDLAVLSAGVVAVAPDLSVPVVVAVPLALPGSDDFGAGEAPAAGAAAGGVDSGGLELAFGAVVEAGLELSESG